MSTKIRVLERSKEKQRQLLLYRRIFGWFLALAVVAGFVGLLNTRLFRLTDFGLSGQTVEDKQQILIKIKETLSGRYLGLIPRDSVFFYQTEYLEKVLRQNFPRLNEISFLTPKLNSLQIKLSDKGSRLVWCASEIKEKNCYFLDKEGFLYSLAPNFSEALLIELYGSLPVTPIGKQILPKATIKNLADILFALPTELEALAVKNTGWEIARVNILPAGDWEVIIRGKQQPERFWKIIFNEKTLAVDLLSNLRAVAGVPAFQQELAVPDKTLDYLDLRFGRKVFYKFKIGQ